MNFVDYILENNNNGVIEVKIIPNARNNEFVDVMANGVIKVKISAIPEKGKANKELLDYLSSELRLKKDCIHIISGVTSQIKKIKLDI